MALYPCAEFFTVKARECRPVSFSPHMDCGIVCISNHELMMVEGILSSAGPAEDLALRREVKGVLDEARSRIRCYTGLYTSENLVEDIRDICNIVAMRVETNARLRETINLVEERCRHLAIVADRFGVRDPASITTARALAVAAVDMVQDVVVDLRKSAIRARGSGSLLKKRAR